MFLKCHHTDNVSATFEPYHYRIVLHLNMANRNVVSTRALAYSPSLTNPSLSVISSGNSCFDIVPNQHPRSVMHGSLEQSTVFILCHCSIDRCFRRARVTSRSRGDLKPNGSEVGATFRTPDHRIFNCHHGEVGVVASANCPPSSTCFDELF